MVTAVTLRSPCEDAASTMYLNVYLLLRKYSLTTYAMFLQSIMLHISIFYPLYAVSLPTLYSHILFHDYKGTTLSLFQHMTPLDNVSKAIHLDAISSGSTPTHSRMGIASFAHFTPHLSLCFPSPPPCRDVSTFLPSGDDQYQKQRQDIDAVSAGARIIRK